MKKTGMTGFTIVELMIAMGIFGTMLIICATAMIFVGRQLHKADVSVLTQNAARSIMEEVGRQVQLSSTTPVFNVVSDGASPSAMCIGSIRYSYQLNKQIENANNNPRNQQLHALWRDVISNSTCNPADLTKPNPSTQSGSNNGDTTIPGNGQELLPLHTRLTHFTIKNTTPIFFDGAEYPDTNLYEIDILVAYGDNDVLTSANRSCISSNLGGAFCATSHLHTTVFRRVQ